VNTNSKNPVNVAILPKEEEHLKYMRKNPVIRPGKIEISLAEISGMLRQKILGGKHEDGSTSDDGSSDDGAVSNRYQHDDL